MPDLLVRLYDLPDVEPVLLALKKEGIDIKQAIAPEKEVIVSWVRREQGCGWASECDVAFSNHPVSCYIASHNSELIGFACYDSTYRNYFGPTYVKPEYRGKGAGRALLLKCLHSMAGQGYAYAIIGSAGPVEYYIKTVGAVIIDGSDPGIYKDMLRLG